MNTQLKPITVDAEITEVECQQQIAASVRHNLCALYPDPGKSLVGHLVNEVLYQISFSLRRGKPLALEAVGLFIPAEVDGQRVIQYHPDPALFLALGNEPAEVATLADRRKGGAA